MASTPSSRYGAKDHTTPSKISSAKHRIHFTGARNNFQSPLPAAKDHATASAEHPVEVIGRIRDFPERVEKPASILEIPENFRSVRVRTDAGYRDFSLDGVSNSADESLEKFYQKFVESRIKSVRLGSKCTIMMYGPTGSGKSHTMFGSAKERGIVYRALKDILGEEDEEEGIGSGIFVQVAVMEIYNEEIYDLLSGNAQGGGVIGGLPKGTTPKVKLEIIGKKAKNATYISGNDAGKLSKEIAKVEKRRIVRSTLCNERSSRSHCLIILDVPLVGGRLMLVDMAGSENIEQAGQIGLEAKLQTAKINQGNVALKRVVESIANGDSHVPFRDSKLTMLLQDSFEDDKSKILMILCASPDPTEIHKTISTLEYGAKAKCIVRSAHLPTPSKQISDESAVASRITALNQFILKLQAENKIRVQERDEAHRELAKREQEAIELRSRLERAEQEERTMVLKQELERMEKKIREQERELEILRRKLDETSTDTRFSDVPTEKDTVMEKSMELDRNDEDPNFTPKKNFLSTVLEEDEEEEEGEKEEVSSARRTRIQNIFRLCGNHREIAQQVQGKIYSTPSKRKSFSQENTAASPTPSPNSSVKISRRNGGVLGDITERRSMKKCRSGEKENSWTGEEEKGKEGNAKVQQLQRSHGVPFLALENRISNGVDSQ